MEMAERFCWTYIGDQPDEEEWMDSLEMPRIVGIEGPQMSISIIPVWQSRIWWIVNCVVAQPRLDWRLVGDWWAGGGHRSVEGSDQPIKSES